MEAELYNRMRAIEKLLEKMLARLDEIAEPMIITQTSGYPLTNANWPVINTQEKQNR